MVERSAVNRMVMGSNPVLPSKFSFLFCERNKKINRIIFGPVAPMVDESLRATPC
jgi:hypothetical protein